MEPVYRWEPATDEYKAAQVDPEAELKKGLEELQKKKPKEHIAPKAAPIAITLLVWYYLLRAGAYAVLLMVISGSPQSNAGIWLQDNLASYMHMPGSSAKKMSVGQKELVKQAEAQDYEITIDPAEQKEQQEQEAEEAADAKVMIKVYLAVSAVLSAVVGFMWLNHSWKIRWITMFYAGAFVAKAMLNAVVGLDADLGIRQTPAQNASLFLMASVNGFIFCYLAFWPGVKEYFEPER